MTAQLEALIDVGSFVPGEPLPPEETLAERFGVNRSTLRKAVEVLEADGVVVRRRHSGTFVQPPAARAARKTSLLYVGSTSDHFFQSFYDALCREATARGKSVTACNPSGSPDAMAQLARLAAIHRRLICMEPHWQQVQHALPGDVHVTRVSGFESIERPAADDRPTYAVSTDTHQATKLAVEYLRQRGHRRIGYVDAGDDVDGNPLRGRVWAHRLPYLGYRDGLQERGLAEGAVLGVPHRLLANGDFVEGHYRSLTHQLRDVDPLPTAFVCVGDFRAGPLLRVLRERGARVPADVSVVSIGNTPWARAVDPPLTSLCLREAEMARVALVLNAEPAPATTCVLRVDPEIVQRQSVGEASERESGK